MILNRYERMIARRYLLPGKGEGFIFLVAGISLAAVMLGVAALIIVMSVMNGFRAELFDKVVGLNGHAVIQGYGGRLDNWRPILDAARRTPGVTAAHALIEQPLMASHEGRVEAILLRGMPVEDIAANPTIRDNVLAGSLAALRPGSNNVAIGARLAELLGLSRRQLDHDHLAAGPDDAVRHGAADRRLQCRRDLRGRPLRFRQGVRDHADGRGAELPDDGRCGRHGRGRRRSTPTGSRRSSRRSPARSPTGRSSTTGAR